MGAFYCTLRQFSRNFCRCGGEIRFVSQIPAARRL